MQGKTKISWFFVRNQNRLNDIGSMGECIFFSLFKELHQSLGCCHTCPSTNSLHNTLSLCRPQDAKNGVSQIRILRNGAHMNLPRNVSFDFYISYMIWKCLSNDHMPNGTEDRTRRPHNLVLLFNVAVWHCCCCCCCLRTLHLRQPYEIRRLYAPIAI